MSGSLAVSRETRDRLDIYVEELRRWQRIKNLVGPKTLGDAWTRHVVDSLQLADLATGRVWADLGSGAGLPGLVVAIGRPDLHVHLIDSDGRRCAFLRHVARRLSLDVTVWDARIETALDRLDPAPEVVTARALGSLRDLLGYAEKVLMGGAVGLFPKGRGHAAELTDARQSWKFDADILPSRTDPDGRIIRVHHFAGRPAPPSISGGEP